MLLSVEELLAGSPYFAARLYHVQLTGTHGRCIDTGTIGHWYRRSLCGLSGAQQGRRGKTEPGMVGPSRSEHGEELGVGQELLVLYETCVANVSRQQGGKKIEEVAGGPKMLPLPKRRRVLLRTFANRALRKRIGVTVSLTAH